MLRICTDGWMSFFFSAPFWQKACRQAFRFAPSCLAASFALAAANLLIVWGTAFMDWRLQQMQSKGISDLSELIIVALVSLAMLAVSLPLSFWALWQWLIKLTAFANWFQETAGEPAAEPKPYIEQMRTRRPYLVRVWLFVSLYLLLPAFLLAVLIALHTLFASQSPMLRIDTSVMPVPAWIHDLRVQGAAMLSGAVLSTVILSYTLVTIVVSGTSKLPAAQTATATLKQCLRQGIPLFVMTAIVCAANVIGTAPQTVLYMTPLASSLHSPVVETCAQLWLAITSLVVWPLSVAPFCRIIAPVEETASNV